MVLALLSVLLILAVACGKETEEDVHKSGEPTSGSESTSVPESEDQSVVDAEKPDDHSASRTPESSTPVSKEPVSKVPESKVPESKVPESQQPHKDNKEDDVPESQSPSTPSSSVVLPSSPEQPGQSTADKPQLSPWITGGKQPDRYTWAEYEALSQNQQLAFINWFPSDKEFEAWMEEALKNAGYEPGGDMSDQETPTEPNPWEAAGAKQPADYTWAEFEALTAGQQIAFQNSFASTGAFDKWLQKAQSGQSGTSQPNPWEAAGAKQPADYTWAEFEALTVAQQMAFQNSFASPEAFDKWLQKAQSGQSGTSPANPWEAAGAKQPANYTWAEFEALTAGQQIAFQNSFASPEAFDEWLQKAQSGQSGASPANPWEAAGAKQPADYTWAEFEALTAGQQIAFQNSFSSIEAFDEWLQEAQSAGSSSEQTNPWEAEGAKQPADYTWAEFEALTAGQQMAFQNSFGSIEEFDKWLTANEP